jgi:hypothetical protein
MTCKELHAHFEKHPITDHSGDPGDVSLAEHVSTCAGCNRFVESLRDVASGLGLFRESAPGVPASLDAAVLARFRDHRGSLQNSKASFWIRRPARIALASGIALAAVLALIAAFLLPRKSVVAPLIQAESPHPSVASGQGEVPRHIAAAEVENRKKPHVYSPRQSGEALSAVRAATRLPGEAFRSLMYCDELSCGEGLELVRVQLPFQAMAMSPSTTPNATQFERVVSADVLVGPDGVARGIRIVQ